MNPAAIPAELRELRRWVVWRWGAVDPKTGKRKKPPYCPTDLRRHGSSKRAETWGTFEQARRRRRGRQGGRARVRARPALRRHRPRRGAPRSRQGRDHARLDSYAERSVSGTGYHVVIRANLNGRGRHPDGHRCLPGRPVLLLHRRACPRHPDDDRGAPGAARPGARRVPARAGRIVRRPGLGLSPRRACRPRRPRADREGDDREERRRLHPTVERRLPGPYPSRSEADLALCSHLAFWTGRDADRIDSCSAHPG